MKISKDEKNMIKDRQKDTRVVFDIELWEKKKIISKLEVNKILGICFKIVCPHTERDELSERLMNLAFFLGNCLFAG